MIVEKIKIVFGKGRIGLTYDQEEGYVIVNKLFTNNPLPVGSKFNLIKSSKDYALNNSFILCGKLEGLIQDVKNIKNSEEKIVVFKNFILDFNDVDDAGLDIFISICEQAIKTKEINVVL